jgi:putative oxidoreductase
MLQKIAALRARLLRIAEKMAWLAPLVIRISVGVAFAVTGWGKLNNLPQIVEFFRSLNIPAPEIQAPFVSGLEFFGGLAIIFGLGARLFSVPLMGTMVVAILTANLEKITAWTDLFDLIEWHYFVFFFVTALLGPGPVSLDHLIAKKLFPAPAPVVTPAGVAAGVTPPLADPLPPR